MPDNAYDVINLKALRCLWATARCGSLTAAGHELGISDVAVAKRIRSLEKFLNTRLYESHGGHIRLTAVGERTASMAMDLFDRIEAFQRDVPEFEKVTTLTLASYDPVLRYLLPRHITDFTRSWPMARLVLRDRTTPETVQLVETNEVDTGIVPAVELPEALAFHPIVSYPAFLITPLDHPLARCTTNDLPDRLSQSEINRYQFVVPTSSANHESRLDRFFSQRGLSFDVVLEVGSIDTVKQYVMQGIGIAVVPGICLTPNDHMWLSAVELPDEFAGNTTYGVILRRDKYQSAALKGLLNLLGLG